jgi:type II secretory pathway component PulJ
LLLSILIGAIVLTVLYSSFFQIINAKDSAESELELYHEVRVVFSKMTEDLAMAYPMGLVFPVEDRAPSSFFLGKVEGENSSVEFTALSHKRGINSQDSDEAVISYFLEPIPESDLFLLMRSENSRIGSDSSAIRYALSERVVGLNLFYLSTNGEEFLDAWDSVQTNSLPKAVEIRLTMRSSNGEDIVFSSLVLIPSAN